MSTVTDRPGAAGPHRGRQAGDAAAEHEEIGHGRVSDPTQRGAGYGAASATSATECTVGRLCSSTWTTIGS